MKNPFRYNYICTNCGRTYTISKDLMLCPACREESLEGKPLKGILKVQLPGAFRNSKKNNLADKKVKHRHTLSADRGNEVTNEILASPLSLTKRKIACIRQKQ